MRRLNLTILLFSLTMAITACRSTASGEQPNASSSPSSTTKKEKSHEPQDFVGKPAPAFSLPSVRNDGKSIVVPTHDVTVLIFFGSWSGGSKYGLAQLEALHQKHKKDGLRVLAVSMDETKEMAAQFGDDCRATFPIAWAGGMASPTGMDWISGPYGGENKVWILDRAGVVRFVHRGGKDTCRADSPEVEDEIVKLLAERAL